MALNELEVLLPNYEDIANQIEQFREEAEEINGVTKNVTRKTYGIKISINKISNNTGYNNFAIYRVINNFMNYNGRIIKKFNYTNDDGGKASNYYFFCQGYFLQMVI